MAQAINYDRPIPDTNGSFEIQCPPNVDIWEKPPSTHSFSAPIIYKTIRKADFSTVRITVDGDWTEKYDQGGLCLVLKLKDGSRKWIKAGIEYFNDTAQVSVVGTDRWSDWSLRPTASPDSRSATVEAQVDAEGTLWLWLIDGQQRLPLREIAWWIDVADDTELWIGASAARPAKVDGDLTVRFQDWVLETK